MQGRGRPRRPGPGLAWRALPLSRGPAALARRLVRQSLRYHARHLVVLEEGARQVSTHPVICCLVKAQVLLDNRPLVHRRTLTSRNFILRSAGVMAFIRRCMCFSLLYKRREAAERSGFCN